MSLSKSGVRFRSFFPGRSPRLFAGFEDEAARDMSGE